MKLRTLLTLSTMLTVFAAWADVDVDSQDIGSEQIAKPARRTPFSFSSHFDAIGSTKIDKGFYKGYDVHYATAEVEAGMVVYYCPAYTEGIRVAAGYTPTHLRWSECPWFDQDRFNTIPVTVSAFSKRLDDWFWRTQLSINLDADHWKSEYISYDILLWGRYSYRDDVGIHLGFFAQTGLRMDRVYPVIGFDWTISPKWKLNLVYPVDIALEYSMTKTWKLALAGRFFNSRFRVSPEESTPRALVRYTNFGAEFALRYENNIMSANIHVGTTLAGKFRQANPGNHHAHTFNLDSAAYAGGEIDVKF